MNRLIAQQPYNPSKKMNATHLMLYTQWNPNFAKVRGPKTSQAIEQAVLDSENPLMQGLQQDQWVYWDQDKKRWAANATKAHNPLHAT